jgi:hypothetical protein
MDFFLNDTFKHESHKKGFADDFMLVHSDKNAYQSHPSF